MRFEGSYAWLWIPIFLALNLLWRLPGNPNPGSRLATLAAMTEYHSFRIEPYVRGPAAWTNDWAQTPDGHFYSNKAPAPMLLGWPVFKLVDLSVTRGAATAAERDLLRRAALPRYNVALCITLQLLPMALVMLWALRWLVGQGISGSRLHAAALAILFGQTAALLMNTFFGHAFAAVAWLAFALALAEIHPMAAGLSLGLAVLGDYGSLVVAGPALIAWAWRVKQNLKSWIRFGWGLLIPAALWTLYHAACFGSPFTLALKYQNPEFVDRAGSPGALWGILGFTPNPRVLWELLAGNSRGILITCPWIFVTAAGLWVRRRDLSERMNVGIVALFALAGLGALLLLNASFGGWHGGRTIGPRYLSILFPVWGLLSAWTPRSRLFGTLLGLSLALSMVLALLVFHTTLYVSPGAPLWPALSGIWLARFKSGTAFFWLQ